MHKIMFSIHVWPTAILHLDGNAFFASIMQAVNPKLQGKPVVVGAERGIATAISYEARRFGVKRGMLMAEIKKLCPAVVILPGDYELFSLFSQKMFTILKNFSPLIEEYSVDEGFADVLGLRRPLNSSYLQIAQKLQTEVKQKLGLPISIGISLTKSLAKLASGFKKPLGITIISGRNIEPFLAQIPIQDIWGIGRATTQYLHQFNLKTALQFASLPETTFTHARQGLNLNKNHYEIWQELRGKLVYQINPKAKNSYKSISKTRTFRPATNNEEIVWAELINNVENAFKKARQYGYFVKQIIIFLKTQAFKFKTAEINLKQKQLYPMLFKNQIRQEFKKIFDSQLQYRATGCVLTKLSENSLEQGGLFNDQALIPTNKTKRLYSVMENQTKIDFGSSLFLKDSSKRNVRIPPKFNLPMLYPFAFKLQKHNT